MNYIKQINAFYDLMDHKPVSASAVNLWHTLLHINNKAKWSLEFTVSSTVLKWKGSLAESSFQRARKELVNRGLLEYRTRGRNMAPVYRLKKLYEEDEVAVGVDVVMEEVPVLTEQVVQGMEGQTEGQVKVQANGEMNGQPGVGVEALIKQKESKPKETKQEVVATTAAAFYKENFRVLTPFVKRDLIKWIEDVGEDLVIEAMERALERGKTNWGYVKSILKSWLEKGIWTVEAAREERLEKGNVGGNMGKAGSWEVVPEWFLEQKRKRRSKREESGKGGAEFEDVGTVIRRYLGGE